jgi:CheY-like chemotaxis protein
MLHPTITAARRRPAAAEEPATGKRRALRPKERVPLVLIVDDADDTRDLYVQHFEEQGFRVAHAADGEHALFKIATVTPDLVVMDLAMPVLDGWTATQLIKTNPRTRHIPVIALTGQSGDADLARAKEAGADAVVTKPCAPPALVVIVRRLLGN